MFTRRSWFFSWLAGFLAAQEKPKSWITHGPMLGRPGPTQMGIWARTATAGSFMVQYGVNSNDLNVTSPPVVTRSENDNTGWVLLRDLKPDTRYYYVVLPGNGSVPAKPPDSFRTLPAATQSREWNPKGLFNFSFDAGSGNNQTQNGGDPATRAYGTMLKEIAGKVNFSIFNGDWIYEDRRDYPLENWMRQAGVDEEHLPPLLKLLPTITGVWENYKVYMDRSRNLTEWHRRVPTFFTYDDHEILGDVSGTAEVGLRDRATVFRDIGVKAWYDYLGWSNPVVNSQPALFGNAQLKAGSDVLTDAQADFTKYDKNQGLTLHVHWGGRDAGYKVTKSPGDPNAGVYEVLEVLDKNRLRIRPAPQHNGVSTYSIGKRSYYDFRVGNAHFFVLDCRGERTANDFDHPERPDLSMLGPIQKAWLKEGMAKSDADFMFVVSSVNFMTRHTGGGNFKKSDSWPNYLVEREELIQLFDSLGKPVFILSADIHVAYSIKITERVWEIAPGPHGSHHHPVGASGFPPNGVFDAAGGRKAEMRWCTFMANGVDREFRRKPLYGVFRLNNVYNNPVRPGEDRWVAWPKPFVSVLFYDGVTGELLYSETVHSTRSS